MLRNRQRAALRNHRWKIVAVASTIVLLIVIVLSVTLSRRKSQAAPSLLDRIECPAAKDAVQCVQRGCTYDPSAVGPDCYFQKTAFGYSLYSIALKPEGPEYTLKARTQNTPYGPAIQNVVMEVTLVTENILRLKFKDVDNRRYEVPVQKEFPLLMNKPKVDGKKLQYRVDAMENSGVFEFKVIRLSDDSVLFDSSIGGLVMSNQFLQLAGYLPSKNIYGIGENTHPSLRHDTTSYRSWPLFARDRFPGQGISNLYGAHPFYMCLENSRKSHGVLLLNSNAMEITVLPAPAVSFRTTGGVLDFFFFLGDNPEHVVQLYTSLIGRPQLPPYWSLGFQLARYGYNDLETVKKVVDRTHQAGIPQEVQFLDIDHMDANKDFTYDTKRFAGLPEYITRTKEEQGLKWIIILDPAIASAKDYTPYETGLQSKVFIKRSPTWSEKMFPEALEKNNVTYGKVWPEEEAAFPDFFLEETKQWWKQQIIEHHKTIPFDGLWIDMNEPSSFGTNEQRPFYCPGEHTKFCWVLRCPGDSLEDPPYNPLLASGSDRISKQTICMGSAQGTDSETYLHYDVHSLYGWSQSKPTLEAAEAATNKRSIVISRSTYPSSGSRVGHWLGDNKSSYQDMRDSIIGMLEFGLFGIPYIGADVCGFNSETTEELCSKWMQLGSFYPFFRNHNGMGEKDQDPAAMGERVKNASRSAVMRRYKLQPYLYTLFFRSHTDGATVVRPLHHEFSNDEHTWDLGTQFMWGQCLLVSPLLIEGETSVTAYIPKDLWWRFDFEKSAMQSETGFQELKPGLYDEIPVHARGGCILPTENYEFGKRDQSKGKSISIFIFPGQDLTATGEIFVDDGESRDTVKIKNYTIYQFAYKECSLELKSNSDSKYSGPEPLLYQVHVFRSGAVEHVTVGTADITGFSVVTERKMLTITVNQELKGVQKISWGDKDKKCQMS